MLFIIRAHFLLRKKPGFSGVPPLRMAYGPAPRPLRAPTIPFAEEVPAKPEPENCHPVYCLAVNEWGWWKSVLRSKTFGTRGSRVEKVHHKLQNFDGL
jgi:hypothetical protein